MRVLLLFRGAPGCGKTTFIKENKLTPYTLSADTIRLMFQGPQLDTEGKGEISQKNDREVWKLLFQLLTSRMERGEFTVIDATNSRTEEMNKYRKLADKYRYRIYLIDKTDLPIEECKRRNAAREDHKVVPEVAIDKMYARFQSQSVPAGIKVIKEDELSSIWYRPSDFSDWKRIHHIGDIHGVIEPLNECLKDMKEDELYIFLGDYIDRGSDNVAVVKKMIELSKVKNVILLEGNHEKHLWAWANDEPTRSAEFERHTRPELDNSDISKGEVRQLYRKLCQLALYNYKGFKVLVTHGGLSDLPNKLTLVPTYQIINGVGRFEDIDQVARSFERYNQGETFQIFAHRNPYHAPIEMNSCNYNLEGQVEHPGGHLREVVLDDHGFSTVEYETSVKLVEPREEGEKLSGEQLKISDLVYDMKHDKLISVKEFGNISSFNFTRGAFTDKKWTFRTTKARGLFIDTSRNEIAARSYEKFFNLEEVPETKLTSLFNILKFPLNAYVKYNGFLAMVSYDKANNDFFITSKSTPDGPMALLARRIILSQIKGKEAELKEFVKRQSVTLVFEVISPEEDPHIIKYKEEKAVLLDVIENSINYNSLPYEILKDFAKEFSLPVKELAFTINSWFEFTNWLDLVRSEGYKYNGEYIEGFVVEDPLHYKVKIKLDYYNTWKKLRRVSERVLKEGSLHKTGLLVTPLENEFYGWLRSKYGIIATDTDIITLRDLFYKERVQN